MELHINGSEHVGPFFLWRDSYFAATQRQGHSPADPALGLELGYTPVLARLICLAAVNHPGFEQAAENLGPTGVIEISRCIKHSGERENFWKCRANEHAARNNTLKLSA